jgi:hypothetical protein
METVHLGDQGIAGAYKILVLLIPIRVATGSIFYSKRQLLPTIIFVLPGPSVEVKNAWRYTSTHQQVFMA